MEEDNYINRHDLERLCKEMLGALREARPDDPFEFLIKGLQNIQQLSGASDSGLAIDYQHLFLQAQFQPEDADAAPGSLKRPAPADWQPSRRISVSAESYQPSEIDPKHFVVIPKTPEAVARIEKAVSENLLFNNLDEQQRGRIIDAMFERHVLVGELIIKEGDEGDNFYVVDQGKFSVQIEGKGEVSQVGPGGIFGELALMYNNPRSASVIAMTDGLLWAVDRFTFRKVIIDIASRKRKMYEGFLRSVPLLSSLSQGEICRIADALEPSSFSSDEVVIRQGEKGDRFYIIVEGEAEVFVDEALVNSLGPGDYFGELALLNDSPRAATIIAKDAMNCIVLDASSFKRLLGPLDEILKRNEQKYTKSSVAIGSDV